MTETASVWVTAWIGFFLAALVVALGGIPTGQWLKQKGLIDFPEDRRLHRIETPRGGGVLMALAMLIGLVWIAIISSVSQPLIVVMVIIGLVTALGWLEDLKPRSIVLRLIAQFAIASLVIVLMGPLESIHLWRSQMLNLPVFFVATALIGLVWVMNLHNFMDGSDGMAASQGLFCGLAYATLFALNSEPFGLALALLLSGSCLGFLFWNWPPARLFMGDSGSLLIGVVVGLLAYHGLQTQSASLTMCLIISSVFVVDTTATLVSRVVSGQRWYNAHATHAFQQLVAGGLSHGQVLVVYWALNLGVVAPALFVAMRDSAREPVVGLVVFALLIVGWWNVQHRAIRPKAS